MTQPLMTCRELIEFLDRYVAGELDPEQRREFDAHLALCPPCLAYLETYRAVIRLSRESGGEPPPEVTDAMPEELVAAVLAARRRG